MKRVILVLAIASSSARGEPIPPSPVSMPSLDLRNKLHIGVTVGAAIQDSYCSNFCTLGGAMLEGGGSYAVTDRLQLFAAIPVATHGFGNLRGGARASIRGSDWAFGATLTTWAPIASDDQFFDPLTRLQSDLLGVSDPNAFTPLFGARMSGIARASPTERSLIQAELGMAFVVDDHFVEPRIEAQIIDANVGFGGYVSDCWSLAGEVRLAYVPNQQTIYSYQSMVNDEWLVSAGLALARASWRIRAHATKVYGASLGFDLSFD